MTYGFDSLPPELQQEIRDFVSQKIPIEGEREAAVYRLGFQIWARRARAAHERFLAQLRATQITSGDSLGDIDRKTQQHQDLLRWHHSALHPNTGGDRHD